MNFSLLYYGSNKCCICYVINILGGDPNENQSEISALSDFYCFPKH